MKEITKVAQLVTSKEELISFLVKNIGTSFYDFSDKIIPNIATAENVLYFENEDELTLSENLKSIRNLPISYPSICLITGLPNEVEVEYLELQVNGFGNQ